MSDARWLRLGKRVTAERIRRGYRSLAAFAAAAELSTSTVDNIEHGRKSSYDPGTLAVLEQALGWRAGSVERVLRGLEPEYDQDPDLTAVIEAWPHLSPGARRMIRVLAVEGARAD
jgi:transcriptional regulator with XRE-family HTH domain